MSNIRMSPVFDIQYTTRGKQKIKKNLEGIICTVQMQHKLLTNQILTKKNVTW